MAIKRSKQGKSVGLAKVLTGIQGLDDITCGRVSQGAADARVRRAGLREDHGWS